MPLTYDVVANALAAMDPFRWTWGPPAGVAPRGTATLQRRLARLQSRARAEHAGRGMGDIAHQLAHVDPARAFGLFPDVPALAGRHPVVLAHGPSLPPLLSALARHRDRLYVVAPFRTALRIAASGIWPDVAVLADAAAPTSEISLREWNATPAGLRHTLEARVTLVTVPLAPAAIHRGFARVRLFDDGLGGLSKNALLPYWGSALLPSVCLPLALGAPTVAVGGMNMTANHGPACRTWRGCRARLDPKLAVAHGLLEALSAALPGHFVDLSADAAVKRGFEQVDIEGFLASPAGGTAATADAATVCAADILRHAVRSADSFGDTIARMTEVASRVCDLSRTNDRSPELLRLVEQMEADWSRDPACQDALSLLRPPYLRALWQLRDHGFVPQNPQVAARMKAKLIGPEIAGLDEVYRQWLAALHEAARPAPGAE